jgi:hypothetical protein
MRAPETEPDWELVRKRNFVERLKHEKGGLEVIQDLPAMIAAGYEAVGSRTARRGRGRPPSFIAGSVVRRGDLTVAISTAGKAPALAVRLRQWLEGMLGTHHARFLDLAGSVRATLAAQRPDLARRRELWYQLVDSDVLDLLRHGDEPAARRRFAEILGVEPGMAAGGTRGAGASEEAG